MVLFLTRILGRYCTYFACTYFARWSVLESDVISCVVISVLSFHVVFTWYYMWTEFGKKEIGCVTSIFWTLSFWVFCKIANWGTLLIDFIIEKLSSFTWETLKDARFWNKNGSYSRQKFRLKRITEYRTLSNI